MKKAPNVEEWLQQKNIGPVMSKLMTEAGITVKELQQKSVEDVFWKFWETHPHPKYVHSAYLYALHGAKHNIDWRAVPEKNRVRYQQFVKDFKTSW